MIVGVSGGPDSLALLHFLWSRRKIWNLAIVAAHVDHMFRGNESYMEAKFVEDYCERLGIPCEIKHIDVPAIISNTNKNAQVASRECRYQFYQQVMETYQSDFLALGHHGDDQMETILMRLTRGSTGMARAGILFKRPFNQGHIIRPFLCVNRDEIEMYCQRNQLEPRRDPSNHKDIYSRNRFRKHILPFLKRENPQVHNHFQRYSEEIQSDEEFLQELTLQKMNTVMKKEQGKITLDIKMFSTMPMPLQRRGIQLILKYLYQERLELLSNIHTDQIFSLITHTHPSGKLDLPEKLSVTRAYDVIIFQFKEKCVETYRYEILDTQTIELPNGQTLSINFNQDKMCKPDHFSFSLNPQQINLPLVIRTRKNGDKMRIKG
ncbi:MAG: tRNA lysidine(34) synthetase TilS, partial [Bacillus sp. (in: firmicutes)]